jgi:hypothetical protein
LNAERKLTFLVLLLVLSRSRGITNLDRIEFRIYLESGGEDGGGLVEDVPDGRIEPIFASSQLCGSANVSRTQNEIDATFFHDAMIP